MSTGYPILTTDAVHVEIGEQSMHFDLDIDVYLGRDADDPLQLSVPIGDVTALRALAARLLEIASYWSGPARTAEDARYRPIPGDKYIFTDGRVWTVVKVENRLVYFTNPRPRMCSLGAWGWGADDGTWVPAP